MGWKWVEEPSDRSATNLGFGELVDRNLNPSQEDRCSTRRIVRSKCRTDEVEPGKFIRKCEKTEQLLRDCAGRAAEVVESVTEHTEEDVTEDVKNGVLPFGSSGAEPFSFPGLRGDIEAIERGLLGGFGYLVDAAEEMANDFFSSFRLTPRHEEDTPRRWLGRYGGSDGQSEPKKDPEV